MRYIDVRRSIDDTRSIDKCQSIVGEESGEATVTELCCAPVRAAPLSEPDAEDLAAVFSALADPVRLRILSLIADAGEVCSCNLLEPLNRSQPTVSHHTKLLADAGLIVGEKRGRWVWWQLVPERLEQVRAALA
jgi:ArsR family transcriptional regulator